MSTILDVLKDPFLAALSWVRLYSVRGFSRIAAIAGKIQGNDPSSKDGGNEGHVYGVVSGSFILNFSLTRSQTKRLR